MFVFFTGCSGGGGGSSSNPITSNANTLTGIVVDGNIKEATVCVDINANKECDIDEPISATDANGKFILDIASLPAGEYKVISIGGIDTVTNQFFDALLEEVIDIKDDDRSLSVLLTPLTTLASKIYDEEKVKESTFTIAKAKEKLALSLGLTTQQISANPIEDRELFAKTQKIVQATKIITITIQKDDSDRIVNQKVFDNILTQIALVLSEDTTAKDINISKVVQNIEENNISIDIPTAVTLFTQNYVDEVESKINEASSLTELPDLQNALEIFIGEIRVSVQASTIIWDDLNQTLITLQGTSKSDIIEMSKSSKSHLVRSVIVSRGDTVTDSFVTSECGALGGIAVYSGIDSNNDAILSISEQNPTPQVVCNGLDGTNGFTSLIDTEILKVGDSECAEGGVKIKFGIDLNTDAILQDSELTKTISLCNGYDSSTIPVTDDLVFSSLATLKGSVPVENFNRSISRDLRKVTSMTGGLWLTPEKVQAMINLDIKDSSTSTASTVPEPVIEPISVPVDADGNYEITNLLSGNAYSLIYINSVGQSKKVENITLTPGSVV
ncbi:MAG: hypothetical protein U9O83_03885, partial [Campylobacterota bacterium]|nr:hypothetical protein [Campylobacterota bacterium]